MLNKIVIIVIAIFRNGVLSYLSNNVQTINHLAIRIIVENYSLYKDHLVYITIYILHIIISVYNLPLHPTVSSACAPNIQECTVDAHGAYLDWHSTHPSSVMNSSKQAMIKNTDFYLLNKTNCQYVQLVNIP